MKGHFEQLSRLKSTLAGSSKAFWSCLHPLAHGMALSGAHWWRFRPGSEGSFRNSVSIDCPHAEEEILQYAATILTTPKMINGCFVEAGCYKGGSTAKFSLAAKAANRKLVVFDSFEGIPENDESHRHVILGNTVSFGRGSYCGTLDEVRGNLLRYGSLSTCELMKGWFEDTMPGFREPIAGMYLDVDLACSTRTCLKYLYPLLQCGGACYSHEGHLSLVTEMLNSDAFWVNEVGCQKPHIEGLGRQKLIKIVKG